MSLFLLFLCHQDLKSRCNRLFYGSRYEKTDILNKSSIQNLPCDLIVKFFKLCIQELIVENESRFRMYFWLFGGHLWLKKGPKCLFFRIFFLKIT